MAPPIGYALIGENIDQSPSPSMHNAAFTAMGINANYKIRTTTVDDIATALNEMRHGKWAGMNVTMPLKAAVAEFVQLEGHAKRAQAVNTLSRYGGDIIGALTDVDGIINPINEADFDDLPKSALIIGAGGAARAAAIALDELGCTVHVATRNPNKAAEFLEAMAVQHPGRSTSLSDKRNLSDIMSGVGLIIQATPVGINNDSHDLPWSEVNPQTIAFDMVYRPIQTPFLEAAKKADCQIIEGWKMLLAQGAASFKIWVGKTPPLDIMSSEIQKLLAS